MLAPLILILGYFTFIFIIATIIKNNSIVDIGWGLGFVVTSLYLLLTNSITVDKIFIVSLVGLWGLRLFYHILKRNLFKEEDFRYQNWRKAWGKWVIPRAFFQVFMLQGILMYVIGSGVFYYLLYGTSLGQLSYIGITVFLVGFYTQVKGDLELKKYLKDPNRKPLLTTGLWSITRHPNYTGESTMWIGLFITVFGGGVPFYFIISPITITVVLQFISIPLLEKKMRHRKGWKEYEQNVPSLFPSVRS
jgi:steroid 5-alpha reductase family enzyme